MKNQSSSSPSMNLNQWLMLLLLSLLWGGSFFFTGVALHALPPFTLVLLRVAGGGLLLNLIILAQGNRMPTGSRIWLSFLGMGLLNNVMPFSLIVWGQTHIASGLAAILNATTPLWTVIVAHAFTGDEKLTTNKVAGVIVGFAGVAIMVGPELLFGASIHAGAEAAVVLAALSYGFAAVFGRRFKTMGVAPMQIAAGQLTVSSAIMLPVALFVDRSWQLPVPGIQIWLAVAGFITLSTALAYILYFRLLATAGASNLVLVTFLIPVSAILLGVAFLGETLALKHVAGMLLIGAGLALIDGRLLTRFKRQLPV
jgi:drug/metabolite transporter (DMT)-like permease